MYTDKRKYGPQLITDMMEPFGTTPFNLGLPFTHRSLCLRTCDGLRAPGAVGSGALSAVSMGNNQMYHFSDSRDLFPSVYGQLDILPLAIYLKLLTVKLLSLCWGSFLPH